ncbi:uncharacterized protein EI90DRAFT_53860 [Cantharellus anzutake]|uniref:uncharacterized protein n=1 Tax=Cantharellus anzutake TaxID=1750568 RepID=UPI0019051AF7|nr:uncharacterized protein EI90DRAFT_53860 [Cantharellus anzutake]KAF8344173.1 hypothetical protein EI90DRAFT_53860 [Cantharellus anzutake]
MKHHSLADCVLSCMPITNRVGVSIWEETSLVRIFDALVEIVEQIERMEDIGLYHGDVSEGNIFTGTRDGKNKAWLGDLEFECVDRLDGDDTEKAKLSGTSSFMSEAVLVAIYSGQTHSQSGVDDLESLMWVLLWFFYHTCPHENERGWTHLLYNMNFVSHTSPPPSMEADGKCLKLRPVSVRGQDPLYFFLSDAYLASLMKSTTKQVYHLPPGG